MIRVIIFLFFLIFVFCIKQEECLFFINNDVMKGDYYFYFRPNYFPNSQLNDIGGNGLTTDFASGKVSQEIYDQYEVGDEYCF